MQKIYNYYRIPTLFETSGQPSERELKSLAQNGYDVVINLASKSILNGKIINEKNILRSLQLTYIHIPVDFANPTERDFKKFVFNIQKYFDKKKFIHCQANFRVSAFCYKYRKDILKQEHEKIIKDLNAIWFPNKTWKSFLNIP